MNPQEINNYCFSLESSLFLFYGHRIVGTNRTKRRHNYWYKTRVHVNYTHFMEVSDKNSHFNLLTTHECFCMTSVCIF